jgi:hypothetical protein
MKLNFTYITLILAFFFSTNIVVAEISTSVWSTNYNKMTINQDGDQVTGNYEYDNGVFTGTLKSTVDGLSFVGWWKEAGNPKTCGPANEWSGPVVFLFTSDGQSFIGDWAACPAAPDTLDVHNNRWNGTLTNGSINGYGCNAYTQTDIDNAIEQGKQICKNNPSSCGINVATTTNEGTGTVSESLDIHMPSLNYTTLLGTQNIWVDFKYSGMNFEGKHIWELKDFGVNQNN